MEEKSDLPPDYSHATQSSTVSSPGYITADAASSAHQSAGQYSNAGHLVTGTQVAAIAPHGPLPHYAYQGYSTGQPYPVLYHPNSVAPVTQSPLGMHYMVYSPDGQAGMQVAGAKSKWAKDSVFRLATLQVVSAILCVIFQTVVYTRRSSFGLASTGLWVGIFFMITGCIGIKASKQEGKGWMVAYMVMSILASIVGYIGVVLASIGIAVDVGYYTTVVMYGLIIFLSFLNFVSFIVSAALCCRGACCGVRVQERTVYLMPQGQLQPTYP